MSLIIILLTALATSFISAIFGMAGGLILMGVLLALLPLSSAMVIHGAIQSLANGSRALFLHRHIQWSFIARYLMGSLTAGAILLLITFKLDKALTFIILGLVPLWIWLPKSWFHLNAAHPLQATICGAIVTGLNVIAGVSGPLLDVFFQHTALDRRAIVATKATSQIAAHGVKIAYYILPALHSTDKDLLWIIALAAPLSIAGTFLGGRLLERMSENRFRHWTKRIVSVIGAIYVLRGLSLFLG
ncbi:TSUP family transporter [Woodsholea maritima]|uniref:TSUP family transporter n=1 Tax=Woodsholea maritima TaxID=240237 RepID=UPI00036ABA1D|nr:TSUP family transporter [Woodsholea maritima]